MDEEKMGVDSNNYNIDNFGSDSVGSRVSDHRAFDLYRVLRKIGKGLFKVINFFVPTFVFILGLELLFGLLNLPPYPIHRAQYVYVEDKDANFVLNKGYSGIMSNLEYFHRVKVDQLGFRNSHRGKVKIDFKKSRVLLLGDSMTFGQGVEYGDSFAGLLSRNKTYQVFDAGVPSYGTMNSLGLLREIGDQIAPEVVIYVLYPGNDFYDNARGFVKHVVEGYLADSLELNRASIANEGLVDYPAYSEQVYLNLMDKILVKRLDVYRYLRYRALFIPSVREVYVQKRIINLRACALPYSTSPFLKGYEDEEEYKKTIDLILEMKKYVEKNLRAKFILVNLPIREQVNLKLWEYEKEQGCVDPQVFDLNHPNKYLDKLAQDYKITFVDATNGLKQSFDKGRNPFFAIDTHLNKQGHRVMYELLSTEIKKMLN